MTATRAIITRTLLIALVMAPFAACEDMPVDKAINQAVDTLDIDLEQGGFALYPRPLYPGKYRLILSGNAGKPITCFAEPKLVRGDAIITMKVNGTDCPTTAAALPPFVPTTITLGVYTASTALANGIVLTVPDDLPKNVTVPRKLLKA